MEIATNVASSCTTVLSGVVTVWGIAAVGLATPLQVAGAHVGDLIDTLDASTGPDGQLVVEGKFGLVVREDADGPLEFVCHEAITTELAFDSPEYTFGPPVGGTSTIIGRMADTSQARDGEPLWFTTDLCDWAAVPGFSGRVVADVAFGADGSVWVVTADPVQSGVPSSNAVFHGDDVNNLAPVLTADEAGVDRFLSIAIGESVWVTADATEDPVVLVRAPGGEFTPVPFTVPADLEGESVDVRVALAHPDSRAAWFVVDPIGADRLVELVDDGPTSQSTVWSPDDRITDLSRAPDGTLFGILGDRRPWRIPTDSPPEELTGFVDASGLQADHTGLLLAHRSFVNGLLYSTSADTASPDSTVRPDAIAGPLTCPAGTDQAEICAPLWPQLQPRLAFTSIDTADTGQPPTVDTDAPTGPEEPVPDRPCGCRAVNGAGFSGLLAVLACVVGARRRRTPER